MKDEETTLKELKEHVSRFNAERDWDKFHQFKDLAMDISIEAAEVSEHFIFKTEKEVEELLKSKKREDLEDEMADVLWGTVMLADKCDIDLAKAFENKMAKNAKKYPVEKARGNNKKYTELGDNL
jgi:NTP pyrophosphatase (non-canonical NTP hydrolase)